MNRLFTLNVIRSFHFHGYCDHRNLHSFPTRRSSDLKTWPSPRTSRAKRPRTTTSGSSTSTSRPRGSSVIRWTTSSSRPRSEEHTSELQSPCNLVCRLLLEKKKKNTKYNEHYYEYIK